MGKRFSQSLAIARQSFEVLRSNPSLTIFPIVSAIVTLILTITFCVPTFLLFAHLEGENPRLDKLAYIPMAIFYFISYFVVIFFNVGLAGCTHAALRGEKPTFKEGVNFAASRIKPILGWTLLSATVGVGLQFVRDNAGVVGKIVTAIFGAAWNIVTFLVIPVVAVEGKGPIESVKESLRLLKSTWGEQLIGNAGISLVFLYAALVGLVPFIAVCFTGMLSLIIVTGVVVVLYWLALGILSASLSGIYQTALYVYATSGNTPDGFAGVNFAEAFGQRPIGKTESFVRDRFRR